MFLVVLIKNRTHIVNAKTKNSQLSNHRVGRAQRHGHKLTAAMTDLPFTLKRLPVGEPAGDKPLLTVHTYSYIYDQLPAVLRDGLCCTKMYKSTLLGSSRISENYCTRTPAVSVSDDKLPSCPLKNTGLQIGPVWGQYSTDARLGGVFIQWWCHFCWVTGSNQPLCFSVMSSDAFTFQKL